MRKVFSVAMLIVGTMIGAGFCSGREIVSFFGSGVSIIVAPACGLCIFGCCVLFLSLGSKIEAKSFDGVNRALLGKYHFAADTVLLINNLIVLSAMIAGFNSLTSSFISLPVTGAVAAVLCAVIAARGSAGMLDCNFALVPAIIATLAAVCISSVNTGLASASLGIFRVLTLPSCVVYVSMNMLLASTVLTTLGKLTKGQIIGGSLIASLAITVLLALIISALNCTGSYDAEMPVLEISSGAGKWLSVALGIVMAVSIFTTMLTAVGGLCGYLSERRLGGKFFNSALVIIAGVTVSFLGFSRVVSLFYPLVGVFGLFYIALCVAYLLRSRRKKAYLGGELCVQKRL